MNGRPCELCGGPMIAGQRRRHFTCCAAVGGRPGDVCRTAEAKVDGFKQKVTVCAHCWVRSTAPTGAAA